MQWLQRLHLNRTTYRRQFSPSCHILQRCQGWFSSKSGENDSSFKDQLIRKHFQPDETEAQGLQTLFPNAKKIIDDLFAPFSKAEETLCPTLQLDKSSRMNVCKTKVKFNWPMKTDVLGIHLDEDTSVENAYLRACSLLQHMGLIRLTESGASIYTENEIIQILEELASKQTSRRQVSTNFKVVNLLNQPRDDNVLWSSSLQVNWPLQFTVTSHSQSLDLAFYKTCIRTAMKFKAYGCFDKKNEFKKGILIGLDKYDSLNNNFVVSTFSDPDFEVFVDSSMSGLGAYLLSREDEKIFWISEQWDGVQRMFSPIDSNYNEFYALVTACFTWKHKFVGKKVLFYSDNVYAVNLVNHGMIMFKNGHRKRNKYKEFEKLYLLLSRVCDQYKITLVCMHVPRKDNMAADMLSRAEVEKFKEIVPMAFVTPKKLKKLWFCDPYPPDRSTDDKSNKDDSDPEDDDS